MRKNSMLAFALAIFITFISSCQIDDTGDPGSDDVAKFLGTWSVSDQPARINYQVVIQRDPAYENQILLQNFADAGGTAVGNVVGNNILLDQQAIGGDYNCQGSGVYEKSNRLSFEFNLDDGIESDARVAIFSR